MQENRSFDSYFGTYPGADGIPQERRACRTRCAAAASARTTTRRNRNFGGPHDHIDAMRDIAGGAHERLHRARRVRAARCSATSTSTRPQCSLSPKKPDVMGYHDAREIPNYWSYARHFVLQDHMFEPTTSWSLPAHLYLVSGWSAKCARRGDPMSCVNAIQAPGSPPGEPQNPTGATPDYAWTDLTYLLHTHHVSWRYYVFKGAQPDCDDNAMFCKAIPQNAKTPGIWNPLPWFDTVKQDGQRENVAPFGDFLTAARTRHAAGGVVAHAGRRGERASAGARSARPDVRDERDQRGHAQPDWSSTAIFLAWDDWGGFYDHVQPPDVDAERLRPARARRS